MKKYGSVLLLASLLIPAGIAMADDIYNDLDASIDATLETMTLTAGGPTGTVHYQVRVQNTPTDNRNGCNFQGSESITVSVNTGNVSVATVSPTSLTFSSCGDVKTVTVTPVGAGSTNITLTQTANNTGDTFSYSEASFTVNVNAAAPVDTTAPSIVLTRTPANGAGWNNTDVSLIWTVNDPESTITSTTGCDPVTVTAETSSTVYTCSATSAGGTANSSTTVKIDKTAPVISGVASPAANVNGWNNTDVAVNFTCAETGAVQSGIDTNTVSGDDTTLTTEGAGQSASSDGMCTDVAGNTASTPVTVSGINIDKTKPTISAAVSAGTTGLNGWYVSDVTVDFTCADGLSGIDTCPVDEVLSDEGTAVSSSTPTVFDLAGNESDPSNAVVVKIDKTGPVIAGAASPAVPNGSNGWYTVPVTVSFTCTDATSGVDTNTVAADDQTLSTDGADQSVSSDGVCTDFAGHTASTPVTVSNIDIDQTAPTVTITTPVQNDQFLQGSSVNADWSVSDALSGIDNSLTTAMLADGAAIDTSTTGAFTFNVSATDLAGNTTSVTHNYTVYTYVFWGFRTPVTLTNKEFKQTSTIPVKFQLLNNITNQPVSGPTATLMVGSNPAKASGGSNVSNIFRYDTAAQQYIYNLSTKSLSTGTNTLTVNFTGLGAPAPATTTIVIK